MPYKDKPPFHLIAETTPGMHPWETLPGTWGDKSAAIEAAEAYAAAHPGVTLHVNDSHGAFLALIDPAPDLSRVSDEAVEREAMRRVGARTAAREAIRRREEQLAREMEDAKDAEFAAEAGITYDQYQQVESYVRNKIEDEQR
jgi:hypothetical protein